MFKKAICYLVNFAGQKVMTAVGNNIKARDAFDKKIGITVRDAAKIHVILFTSDFFQQKIKSLSEGPLKQA